jgi:hypothetical protein
LAATLAAVLCANPVKLVIFDFVAKHLTITELAFDSHSNSLAFPALNSIALVDAATEAAIP